MDISTESYLEKVAVIARSYWLHQRVALDHLRHLLDFPQSESHLHRILQYNSLVSPDVAARMVPGLARVHGRTPGDVQFFLEGHDGSLIDLMWFHTFAGDISHVIEDNAAFITETMIGTTKTDATFAIFPTQKIDEFARYIPLHLLPYKMIEPVVGSLVQRITLVPARSTRQSIADVLAYAARQAKERRLSGEGSSARHALYLSREVLEHARRKQWPYDTCSKQAIDEMLEAWIYDEIPHRNLRPVFYHPFERMPESSVWSPGDSDFFRCYDRVTILDGRIYACQEKGVPAICNFTLDESDNHQSLLANRFEMAFQELDNRACHEPDADASVRFLRRFLQHDSVAARRDNMARHLRRISRHNASLRNRPPQNLLFVPRLGRTIELPEERW